MGFMGGNTYDFNGAGMSNDGFGAWPPSPQGLVDTPTGGSAGPLLLTTMPKSAAGASGRGAAEPESCVWIAAELEDREAEGANCLEPRMVLDTYCGLSEPKRRLPKGVPVKKAIPSWNS